MMHGLRQILVGDEQIVVPFWINFLWWLYRAPLCRSEETTPLILLGVALGRRIWWCGVLACCWTCLCKTLDSCHDLDYAIQSLMHTFILCWLLLVAGYDCWWCFWLSLIKSSWSLPCSSPGGLPCTSLVLGLLLLACPAPPWCLVCFWLRLALV
jgi:hypothetical protein